MWFTGRRKTKANPRTRTTNKDPMNHHLFLINITTISETKLTSTTCCNILRRKLSNFKFTKVDPPIRRKEQVIWSDCSTLIGWLLVKLSGSADRNIVRYYDDWGDTGTRGRMLPLVQPDEYWVLSDLFYWINMRCWEEKYIFTMFIQWTRRILLKFY